jgi:hypothetical protein
MNSTVFWDATLCSLVKFTDVLEVLAASIIRAMSCELHICNILRNNKRLHTLIIKLITHGTQLHTLCYKKLQKHVSNFKNSSLYF